MACRFRFRAFSTKASSLRRSAGDLLRSVRSKQILIEVENKVYALNPEINLDNADFIYKELLGFKGNSVSNAKAYFDYFPNQTELDFDSIASDKYCAQFAATPLSVDRLIERALAHQKLPPKSTFIRPKIPTGLLVYKQEKNKK